MKKVLTLSLVILICLTSAFAEDAFVKSKFYPQTTQSLCAQLNLSETSLERPSNAEAIATGSSSYPVTPGDVYKITYQNPSSSAMISQDLTVDASYNIYIPYVGTVSAKGMTFVEFKKYAENQMRSFYSYLNPQFSITRCGSFFVYVGGETKSTASVSTWSFARLSDLCVYATDYASSREVEVAYSDGSVKTYDLLKACLLGDEENNPNLAPECRVTFKTAEKTVWVAGEVKIPGQYQLKEGETLFDLIKMAKGFSYEANQNLVSISSYDKGQYSTVSIDYTLNSFYDLKNLDSVTVSKVSDIPTVVAIQGAIKDGAMNYQFTTGETAYQVLVAIKGELLTTSNVSAIYIERGNEQIHFDSKNDVVLKEGDVIQVPYRNQQVVVAGAVQEPGVFTYEPGRNAEYYINLAGGYTADARRDTFRIIDQNGFTMSDDAPIMPDYTVSVDKRNTNVHNQLVLGISFASLALSLVSAIISWSK